MLTTYRYQRLVVPPLPAAMRKEGQGFLGQKV